MSVHGKSAERNRILGYVVAGLGTVLLVGLLPFYLASGLVAPAWAIIVLLLIWAGLFVLALRWFRRHPFRVIALPVLAAAIWFGALTAGEALLGWTA
ncbi:MAG TPA: hypothetical protein VJ819_15740 [Nocardioidaceae bacterium]|nr:hypothetical protein [Nocardioidaceae bacterium]